MSQLFYYDESGVKKPATALELQSMALRGVINKNTVIETDDGKRARAEKVNGLVFPGDAKSEPSPQPEPFPAPTPKASEERPQTPPTSGLTCPGCGSAVAPGQSFCSKCGAKIEGQPASASAFCKQCGAPLQANQPFCSSCGARQDGALVPSAGPSVSYGQTGGQKYNKTTAGLLALFLGGIGVHKFYLGSWGWGILFACLSCTGIPALCALIEGIIYLTMDQDRFDAKYNLTSSSAFRW